MGGSLLRRSQAEIIQVPETESGFFAIPIMVLAGTPAGPPSAPRRHAAHQVRGIARQQSLTVRVLAECVRSPSTKIEQ
jgi:hypothetical protein